MSVLIKGMEMPCACVFCELYDGDLYWCRGAKKEVPYSPEDKRGKFCPLVEVPTPHGRLIDGDALTGEQYKDGNLMVVEMDAIEDAPTVIEAED